MNRGNSGGPAFNSRGHVVGVATWGCRGKDVQGMNFAVHVDMLRSLLPVTHRAE